MPFSMDMSNSQIEIGLLRIECCVLKRNDEIFDKKQKPMSIRQKAKENNSEMDVVNK